MSPELTTPYAKKALRLFTISATGIGTALCWFIVAPSMAVPALSLAAVGFILGIIALFVWRRHEIEVCRQIDIASTRAKNLKA